MKKKINTFTDFKTNFYSKINDLELFNCSEINLFKVVLDGLKVDYINKGKVRSRLFYPLILFNLINFLKQIQNVFTNKKTYSIEQLKKASTAKIFILDIGRSASDENGNVKSVHFSNIINFFEKNDICVVLDKGGNEKLNYNYDYNILENTFQYVRLTNEEIILRKNIISTFNKIVVSNLFNKNELKNIKFAFHNFFNQFKIIVRLLDNCPFIEKAFFVCHYHKEGKVYAFKKKNIFCIELQHGLIAPEDIFYVFPPLIKSYAKKALFPDKMYVYSNYWKNILLRGNEFDENQIKIIGDYQYKTKLTKEEKEQLLNFKEDCELIVIATQTTLHKYFVDYTKFLNAHILENKLKYKILVKIHPSEKEGLYSEIFDMASVLMIKAPIANVFEYCKIQISIYSTTLYEALPYGVKNYSLDVAICRDYTKHFIDNNISQLLKLDELPFEKSDQKNSLPPDFYYAAFASDVLETKA